MTNPTNIWLGTALPNFKTVRVVPGLNFSLSSPPIFQIGIGSILFTFTGWNAANIANTWNASTDGVISDITAVADTAAPFGINFVSNVAGADFDLVCTFPFGIVNASSTYQQLTFNPVPSGGTFTLTVQGLTTGNITYSATPATFASNMQTAIAALSGFSANDVVVTSPNPNVFNFDFSQGQFIGLSIPAITATYTSLTGGNAGITVTVNAVGSTSASGTNQVTTLSFPATGTHTANVNAVQTIASTVTSGFFNMTFTGYGTTAYLPFTSGRVEIQAALDAMFQAGNVVVSGGPLYWPKDGQHYTITLTFQGTLAGINIPTVSIGTQNAGVNAVQQIQMSGVASGGTFTITKGANTTSALAYNATSSTIQTALQGLASIGSNNVIVAGGPLVPSGSPVTSTVQAVSNTCIRYNVGATAGYQAFVPPGYPNVQDSTGTNSLQTYDGSADGVIRRFMLDFIPSGYLTSCVVNLTLLPSNTTQTINNVNVRAIVAPNPSIPQTMVAYNALTFSSPTSITPSTSTTTIGGGWSEQLVDLDVTSIIENLRAQSWWVDGMNVILEFYPTVTATFYAYIPLSGSSVTSGGVAVVTASSAEQPNFTKIVVPGAYGPMQATFVGALAGTAVTTMTANSGSLTGTSPTVNIATTQVGSSGTYTPTAVVTGGSATVQNISGGSFSLIIAGTTIAQIPYNVTSTALATLINTAFNATVCSVTGGPAPGTNLVITFINGLAAQPITVTFLSSLTTNLAGSMTDTVVSTAVTPYTPTNVWNLVVSPGQGTIGVNSTATVTVSLNDATPTDTPFGVAAPIGSAVMNLATLSPIKLQGAINELLSDDGCRVTRIGHSLEHADVQDANSGQYVNVWYVVDTYQIVFRQTWANISMVASMTSANAAPSQFMVPNTSLQAGDVVDEHQEDSRVANAFVALAAANTPIHKVLASPSSATVLNNVAWRFKLYPQWDNGNENHSGYAGPLSGKIQFVWGKETISDVGVVTFNAIQTSAIIDWDASASLIQTTLQKMFFSVNIQASGTLRNSWLSESLADAPANWYQDLKVSLSGTYFTMPLDDYGYTLQCVLISQTFPNPTSFQKDYLVYGGFFSKTVPPHTNRRESVSFSSLSSISGVTLGLGNLTTTVLPTATAAQIQAALDALFPSAIAAATTGQLPEKFSHQIYVYGTSWADGPIDFEFSGGCCQQNTTVSLVVSPTTTFTVGQVAATTPGVLGHAAIDAVQTVLIVGNPTGGTFTLTFGGHTTSALAYNVSLSALQTAVTTANFSSPTITGDPINGFIFDWAGAGGARAAITSASSLNNVNGLIITTNVGGLASSFGITELVPGTGPSFVDTPSNWSLGRCPNTLDNLIVDDSPSPMLYGLEMTGQFIPQVLSSAVTTVFAWTKNRTVFRNGQQVVFTTAGTPPTGLTNNSTYVIANAGQTINTFTLTDTSGNAIKCSTPGSGTFLLTVNSLTLSVYNRFVGAQIGLPHIRGSEIEPLPQYLKARFSSIQIGVDAGSGVNVCNIDSMDSAPVVNCISSAKPSDTTSPPTVLLKTNNAAATLEVDAAYVGLAYYSDQTAVIGAVLQKGGALAMYNSTISSLNSDGGTITMFNCTVTGVQTIG